MTLSIYLTEDEYSFHTVELKFHLERKHFYRLLDRLYQSDKNNHHHTLTYKISKYQTETVKPYCSTTLSEHGILLYLTESTHNKIHIFTVKAVVNPRKVINSNCSLIRIAPSNKDSLQDFEDKFNALMKPYKICLAKATLTRIDLCVNIQLNNKKLAEELFRLLHKNLPPHKLKQIYFYDPFDSEEDQEEQKEIDKHSICIKNNSYQIIVYDKLFQIKTMRLEDSDTWCKLPEGLLRLELRCSRSYIKELLDTEDLKTPLDQIHWLASHSQEIMLKKVSQVFNSGTYYRPNKARKIITDSSFHKKTREQLLWMIERMRYPFTREQLENNLQEQFQLKPRTVEKRLKQLQKLGINPVPLRKDFYLKQMPSLPTMLELLENDPAALSLMLDKKKSK